MMFNVTYKGFSIGMTRSIKEAQEWAHTKEHKIHVRYAK